MLAEPKAKDLIEAVAGFLEQAVMPKLDGHAAFHARVALNVLAIVARELELGPAAAARESALYQDTLGLQGGLLDQREALCAAIREGRIGAETPGLLPALEQIAADRVRIEQPGYASLARAAAAA
jgi:hypothetical protein